MRKILCLIACHQVLGSLSLRSLLTVDCVDRYILPSAVWIRLAGRWLVAHRDVNSTADTRCGDVPQAGQRIVREVRSKNRLRRRGCNKISTTVAHWKFKVQNKLLLLQRTMGHVNCGPNFVHVHEHENRVEYLGCCHCIFQYNGCILFCTSARRFHGLTKVIAFSEGVQKDRARCKVQHAAEKPLYSSLILSFFPNVVSWPYYHFA